MDKEKKTVFLNFGSNERFKIWKSNVANSCFFFSLFFFALNIYGTQLYKRNEWNSILLFLLNRNVICCCCEWVGHSFNNLVNMGTGIRKNIDFKLMVPDFSSKLLIAIVGLMGRCWNAFSFHLWINFPAIFYHSQTIS